VDKIERGPDRRVAADRRSGIDRRFAERRQPERASAGRRVLFPFDRRIAERRFVERRSEWPLTSSDSSEAQAY
jgi:hypothetical protein